MRYKTYEHRFEISDFLDTRELGKADEELEDAQLANIMERYGFDEDDAERVKEIMMEQGVGEDDAVEIFLAE
jgi:hypothetical protein